MFVATIRSARALVQPMWSTTAGICVNRRCLQCTQCRWEVHHSCSDGNVPPDSHGIFDITLNASTAEPWQCWEECPVDANSQGTNAAVYMPTEKVICVSPVQGRRHARGQVCSGVIRLIQSVSRSQSRFNQQSTAKYKPTFSQQRQSTSQNTPRSF